MKIDSSNVSMNASRRYSSSRYTETMSIETRDDEALMNSISKLADKNGEGLVAGMRSYEKQQEEQQAKQRDQNIAKSMLEYMDRTRNMNENNQFDISQDTDFQISLLRKLLAALNGKRYMDPIDLMKLKHGNMLDLRSSCMKKADLIAGIRGEASADGGQSQGGMTVLKNGDATVTQKLAKAFQMGSATTVSGTTWHRITAYSGYYAESEYTSFQSTGLVKTEDGRNISFGVEVSMSRSFMEEINMFSDVTYIKTDPLIINLNTDMASVSDIKFRFDLDADGTKENISFAGEGSGFLALDRDGNGKIDDGSELFGTKSGDGFKDLAEFDDDGNMWIDENDDIYSRLRIWVKDSEGNDHLLSLQDADVGAIYLGNASTEFSLKNEDHLTNGIIQKTGIYLKESGGVGTVNHVDLTM